MSPSAPEPVAAAELITRVGGNRQLIETLAGVLDNSSREWLAAVQAAIAHRDADLLRKTAHSAKGALATLSAHPAAALARTLEEIAKTGDLAAAPEAIAQLAAEIDRVRTALRIIAAEN